MQLIDYMILENTKIAREVYRLTLEAPPGVRQELPVPGQFVNLQIDGCYLRRPISVCDWSERRLTLIYKAVGTGTEKLAAYSPGETLNVLGGLGNGYTIIREARHPVLIGGGVGVPPLYGLARELVRAGQQPLAILGFNTADEVFYETEFAALCRTVVTTADGSHGEKGFVTDALKNVGFVYDSLYTCGPEPMLRAVYDQAAPLPPGRAQFSFERRMACGFGACMVCSCRTAEGYKRVCKDGPVLTREEILW
ncbi:MAG: dihydroorotate dehydrogenase electron transfer subunit [Oscillospiraceae bacterium]|nr:dihydroorotate dehydrogenase electron transfer subunit [Oscillospiraceae bacterium]